MRELLTIFLLFPVFIQAQGIVAKSAGTGSWKGVGTPGYVMRFKDTAVTVTKQVAKFNLSAAASPIVGWTNVFGDPSLGVRMATDPSGITFSSVATGNWKQFSSTCASDANGVNSANSFAVASTGITYPAGVMVNNWYTYNDAALYDPADSTIRIGGLHPGATYTATMTGSMTFAFNCSTEYRVLGTSLSSTVTKDNFNNSTLGAIITFTARADGTAIIYVNIAPGAQLAESCGTTISQN